MSVLDSLVHDWAKRGTQDDASSIDMPLEPAMYSAEFGTFLLPAPEPAITDQEDLETRFRTLVKQWKEDTEADSSIAQMTRHPAYQQIIGLGKPVIPLLLSELQRDADFWFVALQALTGVDPVPRKAAGKIQQMAKAWVKWGRQHGYIQ
jgi:hypothetical protein